MKHEPTESTLPIAIRFGIETRHEAVIFLRDDSPIAKAEGFDPLSRIEVEANGINIIATLLIVNNQILEPDHAGLSEIAWKKLKLQPSQRLKLKHPPPLESLSYVRSKIYGHRLSKKQIFAIIQDISNGYYMDIQIASFITACTNQRLDNKEIMSLIQAMVAMGETLKWGDRLVVDKHCIGGLPGNRTTPIIVAILAAKGLTIPKTSSRAITSPAGTADVMESMTKVELNASKIKDIVLQQGGCLGWGGSVGLSPADDILITVERALELDSEGQLIASILSKKIAVGSQYILIDIPVGASAKVRSKTAAKALSAKLTSIGADLGIKIMTLISDGSQPIGNGIGPSLEAKDLLLVLRNDPNAPQDLRDKALLLAGVLMEHSGAVETGLGQAEAKKILDSGQALKKFISICHAQGGFKEPLEACCRVNIQSSRAGVLNQFNNRLLAKLAKLLGAPADKAAGIYLHKKLGDRVSQNEVIMELRAESPGELEYALEFYNAHRDMLKITGE